MTKLTAFAATAALLAATPISAFTAPAAAQAENQICMTKKTKGRRSGDKSILVAVTKKQFASMKARGFKKVNCKGNNAERADYQKQICKFARITPAAVQADFKKVHGATPTELCQASK